MVERIKLLVKSLIDIRWLNLINFIKIVLGCINPFANKISLNLKGLNKSINFRIWTHDYNIIRQVFIDDEYNLNINDELNPKFIVDAWANVWFASLYFNSIYPDAAIVWLEPESDNFELYVNNIEWIDSITPLKKWLRNINTLLEVSNIWLGSDGFVVSEIGDSEKTDSSIQWVSIDSIMKEFGIDYIDILKIDIEWSEKELFEKNNDWIYKVWLIIVETHDRFKPWSTKSLFDALSDYDYQCHFRWENIFIIFDHNDTAPQEVL